MSAKLKIFLLGHFTLSLIACAREVVIELPEEKPRLVAVSIFSPNQPFRVKIQISQSVYETGQNPVPAIADVSISKNGSFVDKLYKAYSAEGGVYWESRDTAVVNEKYSMVVRVPGYPTLEASSQVPVFVGLEPVVFTLQEIDTFRYSDNLYELRMPVTFNVADMPEKGRYFAFRLSHETKVYDPDSSPPRYVATTITDSTYFQADGRTLALLSNIPEPLVLVHENYWNDHRTSLSLSVRIPFNPNRDRPQKLLMEWWTLSEEFYRYHLSLSRQSFSLPFNEPDAVFNNISGGYGNFSGIASQVYTVDFVK